MVKKSRHAVGHAPQFDNLLILRGIACLLVVQNHDLILTIARVPQYQEKLLYWIYPYGYQAVWLFFMLSSFLLTKAFLSDRFTTDRAGILHFWKTRAYRLLPLFFAVQGSLILLYALGWLPGEFHNVSLFREFNIMLLFPWLPYLKGTNAVFSLNSPIWSVVLEIHFIAILPFLIGTLKKSAKPFEVLLALWLVGIAGLWLMNTVGPRKIPLFPYVYGSHVYNAGFFLAGMLIAKGKVSFRKRYPQNFAPWLALLTAAGYLYTNYQARVDLDLALSGPAVFLLFPILCGLLLTLDTNFQKPLPGNFASLVPNFSVRSFLEKVGAMSYSVYLVHKPVGYVIEGIFDFSKYEFSFVAALGVDALLTTVVLVVGAICYLQVENRFRVGRRAPAKFVLARS